MSTPISTPVRISIPSCSRMSTRRWMTALSSLKSGTPKRMRPPMCVLRSNSVTVWPRLLSSAAAAMPAGPDPTTATVLPVR
jgi:hypothetical protein